MFLFIPNEIIIKVFLYLNIEDIINVRITCNKFLRICDLFFPNTMNFINKSKYLDKLKIIKKIYFLENDINIDNSTYLKYINANKLGYFKKFHAYDISYYYNQMLDNSIIDYSKRDIYITIFSKYILNDFKKNIKYIENMIKSG